MTTGLCAGEASCAGGDAVMRRLTRRRLLTCSATAAVVATLAPVMKTGAAFARESWLRRGSYAPRVGETFGAVLADGRAVSLRLTAVEDLMGTSPSGSSLAGCEDAFLLDFQGPFSPHLEQGVRELRHRALGSGMLFLVPHAMTSNGRRY